jgi:hypothetical protein
MIIILNQDFRRPRLGSQFSRTYINRDRAEGNAKIMRDYFNPNATYPGMSDGDEPARRRKKVVGAAR